MKCENIAANMAMCDKIAANSKMEEFYHLIRLIWTKNYLLIHEFYLFYL